MSPGGSVFAPSSPKTGTNLRHPRPPQSLNDFGVRLLLDEWLVVARACLCMVISLIIVDLRVRIGHHVNN